MSSNSHDGDISDALGMNPTDPSLSDFWLVKINENGDLLWEKTFGSSGPELYLAKVCEDSEGNILFIGESQTEALDRYFISMVKLDATGEILWEKEFYSEYGMNLRLKDVEVKNKDVVIISDDEGMMMIQRIDENGELVWGKSLDNIGIGYSEDARILVSDIGLWLVSNEGGNLIMYRLE